MSPSPHSRRIAIRFAPFLVAGVTITMAVAYAVYDTYIRGPCRGDGAPAVYVSGPTPGGGVLALALSASGSCAVLVDGAVWCWGWGATPGAVDGAFGGVPHPVPQPGPWAEVSLAEHTRCLVRKDGHAECTGTDRAPTESVLLEGTRHLVLGPSHHCAIRNEGELWCWGPNGSGQLFNGTTMDSATPVRATETSAPVTDVAVGLGFTCVALASGQVQCRGITSGGTLAPPRDLPPTVQLAAGTNHVCARSESGVVTCWGESVHGEWGREAAPAAASGKVPLALPAREIVASGVRTCARLSDGNVWCWGDSDAGDARSRKRPYPVMRGAGRVALSPTHGCIVTPTRDVRCWGDNAQKQVSLHLLAYPSGLSHDRCTSWSEETASKGAPVFWMEGSSRQAANDPLTRRFVRVLP